jgi:hypothetical protein
MKCTIPWGRGLNTLNNLGILHKDQGKDGGGGGDEGQAEKLSETTLIVHVFGENPVWYG